MSEGFRGKAGLVSILAAVVFAASTVATAAPIIPTITEHDLNFGAYNGDGTIEYLTNGVAADTLTYTYHEPDTEVTAYWPMWPTPPVHPVFNLGGVFGGDFVLDVKFTGQDAPFGTIDVSLIGTGNNPAGADLEIWGSTAGMGPGLLWALELEDVSLYGYSDDDTYVLEGTGTVVGGLIADFYDLVGGPGVMRGHLDFIDRPAGWIPSLYDPSDDVGHQIRAAYSGETGVPEPATLGLLLLGGLAVLRRRR